MEAQRREKVERLRQEEAARNNTLNQPPHGQLQPISTLNGHDSRQLSSTSRPNNSQFLSTNNIQQPGTMNSQHSNRPNALNVTGQSSPSMQVLTGSTIFQGPSSTMNLSRNNDFKSKTFSRDFLSRYQVTIIF